MLPDLFLPIGASLPDLAPTEQAGIAYTAARWTPGALGRAVAALGRGAEALAEIGEAGLLAAWAETVEAFLSPRSPERRDLEPALVRLCRLSPEGLAEGLRAVLGGVRERPAAALFARARELGRPAPEAALPVLAILAANLPALAVQPLLPALALGRPVFLKSPSAEPLFAPAFLAALVRREPRLGAALAAATWPGGDAELEAPVLAAVETILAYGGDEALDDLERRAGRPATLVRYGPKTSLAVVGREADPAEIAPGLARDVALFDQRGCLSIVAVYLEGTAKEARELAARLGEELTGLARRWPPGPPEPGAAAAVQQLRRTAVMRGFLTTPFAAPIAAGTVLVEPHPTFQISPGLRTVRVHPLRDLAGLPDLLAPWRGRLQGAAITGVAETSELLNALTALGVSRIAAPGDLQSPDASWHNGGIDPLAALSRSATGSTGWPSPR
ncbi:MAG TPA: acyl-CoA reductase [Thermoanaerobaculia bacterium]|nr:acyl-CoA reductase [Thermoanaerobaculia bacterium]